MLSYTGAPQPKVIDFKDDDEEIKCQDKPDDSKDHQVLLSGITKNSLTRINPIYNARFDKVEKARKFFKEKLDKL